MFEEIKQIIVDLNEVERLVRTCNPRDLPLYRDILMELQRKLLDINCAAVV